MYISYSSTLISDKTTFIYSCQLEKIYKQLVGPVFGARSWVRKNITNKKNKLKQKLTMATMGNWVIGGN